MPRSRRRWHTPPPKEIYNPPEEALEMPMWEEPLRGLENLLMFRLWLYRGLVVDFVLCQRTLHAGTWVDLARIDCCHGEVHCHDVDKHGTALARRIMIREIPLGEAGWKVVDEEYEAAEVSMKRSWEDSLRRWRDA
jgi:hypothetical protein